MEWDKEPERAMLPASLSSERWTGYEFEWLNWPTAFCIAGAWALVFLLWVLM